METTLKTSYSSEIKDLVAALAKAQGVMKPAVFNRINPHFKNKYADFSSCMDACRLPLSENGLAPMQFCETIDGKLNLITMLAHISGQWIRSEFPLIASRMDSQGVGSAMTYAKRYSLCGLIGIVADEDVQNDDDGEAAVGRSGPAPKPPVTPPKEPTKITKGQAQQLQIMLDQCKRSYQDTVWQFLKDSNIKQLEEIPLPAYQQLFERTLREAKEFKETQEATYE